MKVAVIGAGAAGLATARVMKDLGHETIVYEQGSRIGGIWAYQPEVEDDPLGLAPTKRVYSSLYDNLRTNLPSDLMAFRGYPFDERGGGKASWPRFPHHRHVLTYLNNFTHDFNLAPLIRFDARVDDVSPVTDGFRVTSRFENHSEAAQFDAVAVCSGHFSRPRVPELPGAGAFEGLRIHSHNYRNPEQFAGQTVVVLGTGASGADIVQEISAQATKVLWCGFERSGHVTEGKVTEGKVKTFPLPTKIEADGVVIGGELHRADTVLYCTGYEYEFPFLSEDFVQVRDNHVTPLYRDIVVASEPRLGLIGLPFLVVPFPLYAMQANWFAASLDGRVQLPDRQEMLEIIDGHIRRLQGDGVARRHMHRLGQRQEGYYNQLASECDEPLLVPEFGQLASAAQAARQANPATFRDEPIGVSLPKDW